MKKYLIAALLLAGLAPLVRAQSGRGSYVAPVAPPKTYVTYSYSPGVGSYNYNTYKPSSSPAPSYKPSETPAFRSSYSSGDDTGTRPREIPQMKLPSSHWLAKMEEAYARNFSGTEKLAENVNPAELKPEERSRFYLYLVIAQRSSHDYEGAIATYEEGRAKYPESLSSHTHITATEMYYKRRKRADYQKGVDAYGRCADPATHYDYYRNLCLIALGQNDAAYTNLAARGLSAYPGLDPAEYHYLLASCAMQAPEPATGKSARYQNVVASLTSYLELSGNKPQYAYLLRARAHYQLGRYQECIDDMTQQLKHDPGNIGVMMWRASAYTALRNYPAAVQDWDLLVTSEAKWSSHWNGRGWVRCLSGDFAGGLADAQQALRRDSTNAWDASSFTTRGYARAGRGQYAAAAADYTRGLALNPRTGLIYLLRGQSRLKLNQQALARADFAQAVKLGVQEHPTLSTADARKLRAQAGGAPPTRPTTRPTAPLPPTRLRR